MHQSIISIILLVIINFNVSGQEKKNRDSVTNFIRLADEDLLNATRLLRYSILTSYNPLKSPIKGIANFASTDKISNGTFNIYMYNLSIVEMVTHGLYPSNRILLFVKNPSIYRYDKTLGSRENWYKKNSYCFELVLPLGVSNGAKIMNQELARLFSITFGLKKVLTDALILVRTSMVDKIKSRQEQDGNYDLVGTFNNVPLDRLAHPLKNAGLPPLVDETAYQGNVDLKLNIKDWSDIDEVRSELKKYDLDIKIGKRELDMFVISDLNNHESK